MVIPSIASTLRLTGVTWWARHELRARTRWHAWRLPLLVMLLRRRELRRLERLLTLRLIPVRSPTVSSVVWVAIWSRVLIVLVLWPAVLLWRCVLLVLTHRMLMLL